MLRKISIGLAAFFGVVVLIGLMSSSDYDVERSIEINASTQEIHLVVGDLNHWSKWTPWEQNRAESKIRVGRISQGVGATQKWLGDKSGQLKVTRSSESYGVDYDLSFNGQGSITKSSITYLPTGATTTVTWNMVGDMPIPVIGAYVAMIMDSVSGPTLETGLQNLKKVIEDKEYL